MSELYEKAGVLIVLRCWCGIQHAVPEALRQEQLRQHNAGKSPPGIHCPLGHKHQPAGPSEAERLRCSLSAERARHDQTKAELRETEARRRAEKAAKTRLQKRVANGICPCCKRTFKDLARHMKNKHPEMVQEAPDA